MSSNRRACEGLASCRVLYMSVPLPPQGAQERRQVQESHKLRSPPSLMPKGSEAGTRDGRSSEGPGFLHWGHHLART